MIRYRADESTCDYDAYTDVMYVSFKRGIHVIANETERGFVVSRSRPSGEVVGVTILDYTEQFGTTHREIEVDWSTPFIVEVDPTACKKVAAG